MASTGNRIESRREGLGLSRSALAKKLKTTRIRVWRIETGKTKLSLEDAPRWARALRMEVTELLA
jgi:transcriptional regulator with XRE-family HTH domain